MYILGAEERAAADRVLAQGNLFRYMPEAHESDRFEAELAGRLGTRYALATSSGTGALICGLAALGVGPGDEVLMPAFGYVADVLAILAVGAVPVVCEVDESLSLDPADLKARLTDRSRAVLPVHMFGLPSDMESISRIARDHDLRVLEDACQAMGGRYRGRHLGTLGDAGAFSFNQAKIITAGEGGALVTSDHELHERAFLMHDASSVYDGRSFDHPVFAGLAFRMNEVSAAILRVQLNRLDDIQAGLRRVRAQVAEALNGAGRLRPVPSHDPAGDSGTHLAVRAPCEASAAALQEAVGRIPGLWAHRAASLGHSFFEWDVLHERRGAHHRLHDPLAGDAPAQGPDQLPRSREILGRTVIVGYTLDAGEQAIERLGEHAREGAAAWA